MLTRMIKRAQHDGGLSVIPTGTGQCKLGQLMHADDCLLLARASREEAGVVGNVLKGVQWLCTHGGLSICKRTGDDYEMPEVQ